MQEASSLFVWNHPPTPGVSDNRLGACSAEDFLSADVQIVPLSEDSQPAPRGLQLTVQLTSCGPNPQLPGGAEQGGHLRGTSQCKGFEPGAQLS